MDGKTDKIITEGVVRHAARLSRLELAADEVARFQKQLERILDYVAQLNEVDTDGVQPTTHVLSSMKNVFRDDEVRPSLSTDEALSNAPARHQDFFKVPKVIKDA